MGNNSESKGYSRESYNHGEGRMKRPRIANQNGRSSRDGGHQEKVYSSQYGESNRRPYRDNEGRYNSSRDYQSREGGYQNREKSYGNRSTSYGNRNNSYGNRDNAYQSRNGQHGREDFRQNRNRNDYENGGERTRSYGSNRGYDRSQQQDRGGFRNRAFNNDSGSNGEYNPNAKYSRKKQIEYKKQFVDYSQPMRLNKFLANSGICSRREADDYIGAGVVTVNGVVVTELGSKIIPATDKVMFHDQPVKVERKVYILLNKPKDCVTTVEDTHDRMTVLDLVKNACSERVYPVGRLDRNTTGVLLITNDGDLTSKLTHPKYDKKKIYQVTLDKDLSDEDYEKIIAGITLEDGFIKVDELAFVKEDDRRTVGVEIHSGRNRIVRRIFDHLGYHVMRLDRVYFAGLTKKNLPRGRWRYLTEMEVNMLKMTAAAMKD